MESPETDPVGPALCATDSDAFSINGLTLSALDSEGQRSGVLKLKVAASLGFEPRKTLPRGFHGLNMLDCHGDREVVYVAASLGFEPRQRDSESLVLPLHYEATSEQNKDRFVSLQVANSYSRE